MGRQAGAFTGTTSMAIASHSAQPGGSSLRALREKRIAKGLFVLLLLCYGYTLPRWADPNQNSRLDMVIAVVEDGHFEIDEYVENTVDYAKVGEHYYSDKAPGAAFVGIPIYAVLKEILDLPLLDRAVAWLGENPALVGTLREGGTGLLAWKLRFALAQAVLTFFVSAVPSALLGVLMYHLLARFTEQSWPRVWVVVAYGLASPAFAYAGAFYGHQLCAACLFASFYLIFSAPKPIQVCRLLGTGLLLGYSVITEYPAVVIAGILFWYTLARVSHWWRAGWVILSGALVAGGWMVYNRTVFGGVLELGYSHSELWTEQHSQGFMSLTQPTWEALWGITFSPFRGLFVLSPLLLLSLPGFVLWYRSGVHRLEFWVALTSVGATFLFNSSSIMWWGGYAVGPRYLLPALPFLALPITLVLRQSKQQVWIGPLVLVLFAWSLVATWGLSLAGQAYPADTLGHPLVEYAWPNWRAGNIARNLGMFVHLPGAASLLPLLAAIALLIAVLWLPIVRRGGVSTSRDRISRASDPPLEDPQLPQDAEQ